MIQGSLQLKASVLTIVLRDSNHLLMEPHLCIIAFVGFVNHNVAMYIHVTNNVAKFRMTSF